MEAWPPKLHEFVCGPENFEIFIDERCLYSRFVENSVLTFNLEGYGKYGIALKE